MPYLKTLILGLTFCAAQTVQTADREALVFKAGHSSLQSFILSTPPKSPKDNPATAEKAALGEKLFFDPRLSGNGNMSCASCHNPMLGWSDGLDTAVGFNGEKLARATPSIINVAYNSIQMWDGSKRTLEDQAIGPMEEATEMHTDFDRLFHLLKNNSDYQPIFSRVFPNQGINKQSIAKALSDFERTIISTNSSFDSWVRGNEKALSKQQVNGFKLFVDKGKGNCLACHSGPNFTDNSFHNIGLLSFSNNNADLGRYKIKPLNIMRGAFKTPGLREIAKTSPYFHDGSATTLYDAVAHYSNGKHNSKNLSPEFKQADLSEQDINDIVSFLQSLSEEQKRFQLPLLTMH